MKQFGMYDWKKKKTEGRKLSDCLNHLNMYEKVASIRSNTHTLSKDFDLEGFARDGDFKWYNAFSDWLSSVFSDWLSSFFRSDICNVFDDQ